MPGTTQNTSTVQTLLSTPRPQTAKEIIATNVQLLIGQLGTGHSETLAAFLTAMGRIHSYSFGQHP